MSFRSAAWYTLADVSLPRSLVAFVQAPEIDVAPKRQGAEFFCRLRPLGVEPGGLRARLVQAEPHFPEQALALPDAQLHAVAPAKMLGQ